MYYLLFPVVPARAGVILMRFVHKDKLGGGSRASGGDPSLKAGDKHNDKWFPRERG